LLKLQTEQPVGVVEGAQLTHERWIAPLQQFLDQQTRAERKSKPC
jgi:hypothetical protein